MSRRLLVCLTLAAFGLLPSSASAAAPALLSVGQDSGRPTAKWSLPAGVDAADVEVATGRQTTATGAFVTRNAVIADGVRAADTSWEARRRLDPGKYFVHVGGTPTGCPTCAEEWSNVLKLLIRKPRRYVGRTSQGQKISFTVAGLGTRVENLRFGHRGNCAAGTAQGKTRFNVAVPIRNERFSARSAFASSIDRGTISVRGRLIEKLAGPHGLAKGTLHWRASQSPIGRCDSGRVSWTARGR